MAQNDSSDPFVNVLGSSWGPPSQAPKIPQNDSLGAFFVIVLGSSWGPRPARPDETPEVAKIAAVAYSRALASQITKIARAWYSHATQTYLLEYGTRKCLTRFSYSGRLTHWGDVTDARLLTEALDVGFCMLQTVYSSTPRFALFPSIYSAEITHTCFRYG